MAEGPSRLDVPLHADLGVPDECRDERRGGVLLETGAAIEGYIEHHNARDARPFRWSRSPKDLVESWKRGHRRLQEMELNE